MAGLLSTTKRALPAPWFRRGPLSVFRDNDPPKVPEPSSMAMVLLGAGGYFARRWTRK
jgi:hypothetical protein